MTRPHLNHATHNGHEWHLLQGVWRRWDSICSEWIPGPPPPPEAQFFNYRKHILGGRHA
jgi:hypothetical protein